MLFMAWPDGRDFLFFLWVSPRSPKQWHSLARSCWAVGGNSVYINERVRGETM